VTQKPKYEGDINSWSPGSVGLPITQYLHDTQVTRASASVEIGCQQGIDTV